MWIFDLCWFREGFHVDVLYLEIAGPSVQSANYWIEPRFDEENLHWIIKHDSMKEKLKAFIDAQARSRKRCPLLTSNQEMLAHLKDIPMRIGEEF